MLAKFPFIQADSHSVPVKGLMSRSGNGLRFFQSILSRLKSLRSEAVEFVWLTKVKYIIISSKLAWSDSCGLW